MQEQNELESMRAQLATLEARNAELERSARQPRTRQPVRARSIIAGILITLCVLIAPLAALGTWARAQLVDTDRFVATFAPIANDPDVQVFIADQAVEAIDASIDIDGLVGSVFSGLASLDLPPSAQSVLPLLEAPAAEGMRSVLTTSVETLVASPQFAQLWEGTLRETHSRAIAVIQGDPNAALQLADDGTLSLSLATVISEVKTILVAQGFGFAEQIPEIDRSIPIVASDSLALVRTVYQLAVSLGTWLPWLTLGLLAAGVALARNRSRALIWGGAGLAVSLLLLALGIGIGRQVFVASVSPSIMPSATAHALFGQVTSLMSSTLLALITLSIAVAIGAWASGGSRAARAARSLTTHASTTVREAAERHGVTTGKFGRAVHRWFAPIAVAVVAIGVLVLFLNRPITVGGVITTIIIVLLVLLVAQFVRRPDPAADADFTPDPAAEHAPEAPTTATP